jgi:type IV pilus assembly protein PilW
MAGTPAAASLIKTICALRVGLILRTELPERTAVNEATSISLFANFPAQAPNPALIYPRTLSAQEQVYRYRTIEATIPVRNNNF